MLKLRLSNVELIIWIIIGLQEILRMIKLQFAKTIKLCVTITNKGFDNGLITYYVERGLTEEMMCYET